MRLLHWLETVIEFARLHRAERANERRSESPRYAAMQFRQ